MRASILCWMRTARKKQKRGLRILMHRWKWTIFESLQCITWGGGSNRHSLYGRQGIRRQTVNKVIPTMTRALGAPLLGVAILRSGCAKPKPCVCEVPRVCCRGLVPQCAACEEGLTLEEWFKKTCPDGETDAHYGGWDEAAQKDVWLCEDEDRETIQISE